MSLVQELKQRTFKLSYVTTPIIIVGCIAGGYFAYNKYFSGSTTDAIVTTTNATVKRGDITIGTTSDGQIKGNNTLSIGFESNGTITSINKQIGDKVKKGEIIALLDSSSLQTALRKSQNSLNQAIANYNTKVRPLSNLEIQQINATFDVNKSTYNSKQISLQQDVQSAQKNLQDLQTKRANYQKDLQELQNDNNLTLKQAQTNQSLVQNAKDLSSQVDDLYQKISEGLRSIDDVMGFSTEQSAKNINYEYLLSAKNFSLKTQAENSWNTLNHLQKPNVTNVTGDALLALLDQANQDAQNMRDLASLMVDVMNQTIPSSSVLPDTQIATRKSSFSNMYSTFSSKYQSFLVGKESYKSNLLSAATNTDSNNTSASDKIKSLQEQIAQTDSDIAYQQKQIDDKGATMKQTQISNDQQLKSDQIGYQLKLNPLTTDEKNLYSLQLEAARLDVADKKNQLDKATLRSPVDGVILTLNGHPGETTTSNFVSIATKGFTYIETSLAQEDVNSIKEGQIASIVLDAVPGLTFTGEVYYISSQGTTDSNGIVTYQVLVKYNLDDDRLKVGMKGTLTFVQKQVKNVLTLPVKAVFAYQNSPHVTLLSGSIQKVITGLSDGKQTEIINGVSEGDVVVIGAK